MSRLPPLVVTKEMEQRIDAAVERYGPLSVVDCRYLLIIAKRGGDVEAAAQVAAARAADATMASQTEHPGAFL